jgi:hypothetical protein
MKNKNVEKKKSGMPAFHFKMDVILMDKLTDLELFEQTQSLSGMIQRILLQMFAVIEKEDYKGIQRMSKYRLINKDKNVKRKHVIVQLPNFLYRRLKTLHDVLNYFSIAQLVRDLLWWYVRLVDIFGENYSDELIRQAREWTKTSRNSHYLIKYIQQLITFNGDITKIIEEFYIYSILYTPYRLFLM